MDLVEFERMVHASGELSILGAAGGPRVILAQTNQFRRTGFGNGIYITVSSERDLITNKILVLDQSTHAVVKCVSRCRLVVELQQVIELAVCDKVCTQNLLQ